MKKIYRTIIFCLTVLLCLNACKEAEVAVDHTTVLTQFAYKTENMQLTLNPDSKDTIRLEWEKSKAADYSSVFYQVLFIAENGDFATPLYTEIPTNFGHDNFVIFSNKQMNVIAERLGIKSAQSGTIKWKVKATNGIVDLLNTDFKTITVQRPVGYAESPLDIYMLGTAASVGDDLTKAIKLKRTATGEFEIFTNLIPGDYYFVDNTTGTHRRFTLDGLTLLEDATKTSAITTENVYRIHLSFNQATASQSVIESVGLWYVPANNVIATLTYKGNSTWEALNTYIEFIADPITKINDQRYKFRITEKTTAGTTTTSYLGSTIIKNSVPTTASPLSYFFIVQEQVPSVSDYTFKFPTDMNKKNVSVTLMLQPSLDQYTHTIVVNP